MVQPLSRELKSVGKCRKSLIVGSKPRSQAILRIQDNKLCERGMKSGSCWAPMKTLICDDSYYKDF